MKWRRVTADTGRLMGGSKAMELQICRASPLGAAIRRLMGKENSGFSKERNRSSRLKGCRRRRSLSPLRLLAGDACRRIDPLVLSVAPPIEEEKGIWEKELFA
ncbi:hypothetical protein Dimus_002954 [Dionaea muscipula]